MKYLSVCSGIEAATVAWHDLGFEPVGFSEIEPFPSAVLAHHYPNVTNFGDMTKYKEWNIGTDRLDLLVGGTPCQSFSVAGLRKGLDDPRGNLALVYCGILDHFRPKWFVWENVPGVLSSNGGRDFGSFLGAVAELGYGFSYRVLDAQFFGVAQRRRRVFVVGYFGDWRPAAAVLFERESLRRDTAPSREKREDVAAAASGGVELSGPLSARDYKDPGTDGINKNSAKMVPVCFEPRSPDGHARLIGDFSPTLNRMGGGQREPCVMYAPETSACLETTSNDYSRADGFTAIVQPAISMRESGLGYWMEDSLAGTLDANMGMSGHANRPAVIKQESMAVRRLTPVECERLQGFPDNYTNIPWRKKDESPDGPRYKALGNSMAVPVMRWIGERIKNAP